jgi:ferric-dicitrate binding protein FerR (iron transport regulator)
VSKDLNNKVDNTLANMRAPFPSKEASWERLSARIGESEITSGRNLRPAWIGIAASIALAIGFFTFFSSSPVEVSTQLAEHSVHVLPDGSTVTLNADSRLKYDAKTFEDERMLELSGEGFFEVKKGSSFKVQTNQGTVTVLGTSFNVFDRSELFEVTCETGKVAVESGVDKVILTPGLKANNSTGALIEGQRDVVSNAWIAGSYAFVEDNLETVLEEVERQFAVDISIPDLSGRLFTGEFDSKDLETTLTVICEPMGLNYSIDGESIVITIK